VSQAAQLFLLKYPKWEVKSMEAGNKGSVAPLPDGHNKCPKCGRRSAIHEKGVNCCTFYLSCDYWERVTSDHIPRLFTEAEIRKIVRQELFCSQQSS